MAAEDRPEGISVRVVSVKPLDEIRQGGMLNLPQTFTLEPWLQAWSTAQIGVQPTGLKPFFINSILMVVPAVAISTIVGALNGYVLTKWSFRGSNVFFGLLLLSCFIPFQIVLIPMARILGTLGLAGSIWGLIFVVAFFAVFARDLPDTSTLYDVKRQPSVNYLDRSGALLAVRGSQYAPPVDLDAERRNGDFILRNRALIRACADLSDGGLALASF